MPMRTPIRYLAFLSLCFGCMQCNEPARENLPNNNQSNADTTAEADVRPVILFFGNSLTAGYGVSPEEAFPALIGERLDSSGFKYEVINAGVSGETTTGGVRRLAWILQRQRVDIFVLELGANDGLRGIEPAQTQKNLVRMIGMVREANPDVQVVLAGMQVPPNMGPEYAQRFAAVFPDVAQSQNVALIPFLLEGVGGIDSLNQADGIHPTAAGQKIVAENVWEVLGRVVR